jgi:general secretion pathway protein G
MRLMRGFTLIELLVTLAVLAVLAGMTVPAAEVMIQRRKEQGLHEALHEIRQALDTYKKAVDDGDIEDKGNESGYPANLDVLVKGMPKAHVQDGSKVFFLRRVPRDPMNDDNTLSNEQTWAKRSYESEADHPVDGSSVYDVYSTSDKVGLNGVPYRQW